MKSFENIDVKSVGEAVGLLQKLQQQKKQVAVVGGGSEYLQRANQDRRPGGRKVDAVGKILRPPVG